MSHTPNFDAKIKTILDAAQPGERVCTLTKEKWTLTKEEIAWCRSFDVPPSAIDPLVRLKMLLAHNTDLTLWYKPHALTGEPLLTFVHPHNRAKIIRDKEWADLDNTEHGFDRDANVSFFEQMERLYEKVPFRALSDPGDSVNTIGMAAFKSSDSFMVFGSLGIERSSSVYSSLFVTDSVDVTSCFGGIGESFGINRSRSLHDCQVVFESQHCLHSSFLFDCRNCEFCFGATNKRYKKYLWFNEQLSKEEWETRRAKISLSSRDVFDTYHQKFFELVQKSVWPETFNHVAVESDGEYLEKTTRVRESYNLQNSTDCFRCWAGTDLTHAAYLTGAGMSSDLWQSSGCIYSQNIKFSCGISASQNMEYCLCCLNCEYCFGCIGLRYKKFCILNKQYTEEDYFKKLDEIKCLLLDQGMYGNPMPADINPLGAQFSAGELLIGYSEEEIRAWGGEYFDAKRGTMYIPEPSEAQKMIQCIDPELKRPFVIPPIERAFYENHQLPLPERHFLIRLKNLVRLSNSPLTEPASCESCLVSLSIHKNNTF